MIAATMECDEAERQQRIEKNAAALQWVADHYGYLRAMCRTTTFVRSGAMIDDLMGEVLDRVPRLFETYNPAYGTPIDIYVCESLRKYLIKFVSKRHRGYGYADSREVASGTMRTIDLPERKQRTIDAEAIRENLKVLSEYELCVVMSRYWRGETAKQIAEALEVSQTHIFSTINLALEKMRRAKAGEAFTRIVIEALRAV